MSGMWEICFLLNGFLLGSLAPLYGKTFNYYLLFMVLFHAVTRKDSFVKDLQTGGKYVLVFGTYFIYILLQTLFTTRSCTWADKPYYGIFEDLLLDFILIPIYVVSLKEWLTPRLLTRFLFLFCAGCLLLNIYVIFDLVGIGLFTDTSSAINFLYANRLGGNKLDFLGGNLYLEPQTLYIALTALIAYFLIFIYRNKGLKVFLGVMFLLLTLFLSFTVTKAGILAFILGFGIMNFYLFMRSSFRVRSAILVGIVLLVPVFGIFVFDGLKGKYEERAEEVVREIENVKRGIYEGGTIAPRIGLIRESFMHVDEFGVWGLGIYAKHRVNNWLQSSEDGLGAFTNVHNSFIHYWIQGGILGLAMIVFLFYAPFYRMFRTRRISWLICALLVVMFVMNNTCILLALNNSRLMILFLLGMFYFYGDVFWQLERGDSSMCL
mgnify:CR=1 FL=1